MDDPKLSRDENSYRVEDRDHLPDETPCTCGSCGAAWRYDQLRPIGDCSLTPGDPSPAGRCPDPSCDSLAYPVEAEAPESPAAAFGREVHRALLEAPAGVLEIVRRMLAWEASAWANGQPIDGGDLVEAFAEWRLELKLALDATPETPAPAIPKGLESHPIMRAIAIAADSLSESEDDQQTGLDEGIYEAAESEEIFARIKENEAVVNAARIEALRILTPPAEEGPHDFFKARTLGYTVTQDDESKLWETIDPDDETVAGGFTTERAAWEAADHHRCFGETPTPLWQVDIYYQTEAGNPGSWRGWIVASDEDAALALAEPRARRERPRLRSIYAGDVIRA